MKTGIYLSPLKALFMDCLSLLRVMRLRFLAMTEPGLRHARSVSFAALQISSNSLSLLTIYCCILTAPAGANPSAAAAAVTAPASQPNIKILSEQMDCNQSHNVCVATGNAMAEKLGDSKVKILKADQITIHFAKEEKTGSTRVTRLEAAGDVSFIIGDIIVQGERGNYLAEEEIAEVFEEVKITNGENQLNGGYGKVNMKTGHYSIKQAGERVQALIFTKEVKKEDARVAEK